MTFSHVSLGRDTASVLRFTCIAFVSTAHHPLIYDTFVYILAHCANCQSMGGVGIESQLSSSIHVGIVEN